MGGDFRYFGQKIHLARLKSFLMPLSAKNEDLKTCIGNFKENLNREAKKIVFWNIVMIDKEGAKITSTRDERFEGNLKLKVHIINFSHTLCTHAHIFTL